MGGKEGRVARRASSREGKVVFVWRKRSSNDGEL